MKRSLANSEVPERFPSANWFRTAASPHNLELESEMLYVSLVPLETGIEGVPTALVGEQLEPKIAGPHTIEYVCSLCKDVPGLKEPHKSKIIHGFRPDEDHARITKSDEWAVIALRDKFELCAPIYWGKGNLIQSPFIVARVYQGELFPWEDRDVVNGVIDLMMGRQLYWKTIIEKDAVDNMPLLNSLEEVINHHNK